MSMLEQWTTLKILAWTKEYLLSKGVINARLESEWLLCSALGLDRVGLYLHFDKPLNETELAQYRGMVARRARREPLQHILGSQEFCGLDFEVSKDVLIPRHDTEVLVSEVLKRIQKVDSVLDVGTGSGCVAIILKNGNPQAKITATDISEEALIIAKRNAIRHSSDIEFLTGSLFAPVAGRCFDLIVSNPPYIPSEDINSLDLEVRDYDPITALDGGFDGLEIYRSLIPEAIMHLNPGGWLILEIGIGQSKKIEQLFRNVVCYSDTEIKKDSNGIDRVICAQKRR